jgi:hypothetical protein
MNKKQAKEKKRFLDKVRKSLAKLPQYAGIDCSQKDITGIAIALGKLNGAGGNRQSQQWIIDNFPDLAKTPIPYGCSKPVITKPFKPVLPAQLSSEEFYNCPQWKALRYKALVLHGARCQCCGATAADGVKIHVDHIKPRSKYPALQWELTNLQVLCEPCNMGKSNIDSTDWRPAAPTELDAHAVNHLRIIK